MPKAVQARQQLHRHGVEHLVADHHAAHLGWQFGHPLHLAGMRGQAFALALNQAARQVDDRVALDLRPQRVQYLQGQRARPRTKLPDFRRAGGLQRLGQLARQGLAKTRREFGRRHKVAATGGHQAEFAGIVGVIAQAWRVEGQRHELVKTQPTASGINGLDDVGMEVGR